ncbi:MAG: Dabb family protein, partial [Sediminibacterium sp.]
LLLSLLVCTSFVVFAQKEKKDKTQLRHVVLFTFKATSTKEEVANVTRTFNDLYGKVPEVKKMEWGLNMSPEHLDQGFTHCFVLTFSSEKDLASYQLHPAHKAFQEVLKPHMDKVFVVDYFVTAK